MNASSQIPEVTQTPVSLQEAPLPGTEFVDRDGDVWVATGHNADGELLLACPSPQNPGDAGEGPSFPWTLRMVRLSFGPLIARSVVAA